MNRKQSDIVVNLPRDLTELEPRIRQTINEKISRGRMNVLVTLQESANGARKLALDTESGPLLPRSDARPAKRIERTGRNHHWDNSPGAGRDAFPRSTASKPTKPGRLWSKPWRRRSPNLIKMREREGKHLAKDLIHRLKVAAQRNQGDPRALS